MLPDGRVVVTSDDGRADQAVVVLDPATGASTVERGLRSPDGYEGVTLLIADGDNPLAVSPRGTWDSGDGDLFG